ncbi:hypothetical protein CIPAW_16G049200 [Carya illinoinensis]|uniref:Uncharacterized protein n=1 Tax=Carya illinoinensis TaxID=32201 RepID=A0A8T1N7M8_CARIL|nr:hypothetical protein CIPAW_16G049200 [Carya illinoinensis]
MWVFDYFLSLERVPAPPETKASQYIEAVYGGYVGDWRLSSLVPAESL